MLDDRNDDMFGNKLRDGKRLEDGIRLRDVDLLVDRVRFGDGDVFRNMFHNDLDGFGILDMSILISSVSSGG